MSLMNTQTRYGSLSLAMHWLMFLLLVAANGGFKRYINTFKGRMGERLLRRLRFELFDRFSEVLAIPLVPVIASLKIISVSLRIGGVAFRNFLFFSPR